MSMISVVIPAYNEENHIGLCLDSLVKQKTNEPFEVIVVDNASKDKTTEVAESYKDKLIIRVLHEPVRRRGAARALGFAHSTGDIVFSTDADAEVPEDWIEKMLSVLRHNHRVVAVTGGSEIHDCGDMTNAIYNTALPFWMRGYAFFNRHYWLNGCNFAIRRSVYEKVGGFNANSDALEDTELSKKVQKEGKIRFLKNLPVKVSGRRFQEGLLQGYMTYAKAYTRKYVLKQEHVNFEKIEQKQ